MNSTLKRLFVLGCLLLANLTLCSADPRLTGAIIVRLDDIQGLSGGQTLVIDGDGNLFARKVNRERKEQRYHIKLSSEDLTALLAFIGKSGIEEYRQSKHVPVPDEAHPEITLSLPNQQKLTALKWSNDKDPKFDKLYAKLLQLVEQAAKSAAYQKKDYDYRAAFP